MHIVVYGAKWCNSSKHIIDQMQELGIEFEVVDVDDESTNTGGLNKRYIKTIPQVIINGTYVGGYEDTCNFLENF